MPLDAPLTSHIFCVHKKTPLSRSIFLNGAPSRNRTRNLLIRSQTLYPVELWAHIYQPVIRLVYNTKYLSLTQPFFSTFLYFPIDFLPLLLKPLLLITFPPLFPSSPLSFSTFSFYNNSEHLPKEKRTTMKKTTVIEMPKLSNDQLIPYQKNRLTDSYYEQTCFDHLHIEQCGERLHLSSCKFDHCIFSKCNLERFDGMDLLFDHCDLSNLDLSHAVFHRCIFIDCRLTGADFTNTTFRNTTFQNCSAAYFNGACSSFKQCAFIQCDLSNSSFNDCEQQHLIFQECNLNQCEFHHTKMNCVDLSTSTIEGILLSLDTIKGMKVNQEQAISLVALLGIEIV